jgi:hypothetical protein
MQSSQNANGLCSIRNAFTRSAIIMEGLPVLGQAYRRRSTIARGSQQARGFAALPPLWPLVILNDDKRSVIPR